MEKKLHTIEFDAEIIDGIINVPQEFHEVFNGYVKVILVTQSNQGTNKESTEKTKILDFSKHQISSFQDINPVEFQRRIRDAKQ
jgi:hypothetical protein